MYRAVQQEHVHVASGCAPGMPVRLYVTELKLLDGLAVVQETSVAMFIYYALPAQCCSWQDFFQSQSADKIPAEACIRCYKLRASMQ
jgi:hypothetical protein